MLYATGVRNIPKRNVSGKGRAVHFLNTSGACVRGALALVMKLGVLTCHGRRNDADSAIPLRRPMNLYCFTHVLKKTAQGIDVHISRNVLQGLGAGLVIAGIAAGVMMCDSAPEARAESDDRHAVETVKNPAHFEKIIENAGDKLLVFDLYADWCMPCKVLSPLLDEIAREHGQTASFYKIDVDQNPGLAQAFGVSGIPYVVFVKNGKAVHAMTGLNPKENYVRAVTTLGSADAAGPDLEANGEIVDGVRVISIPATGASGLIGDIYVYRGDTVHLALEPANYERSVHIPAYRISGRAPAGKAINVSFKAAEIGVFPVYCNGNCPAGDGAQYGRIVVMPYEGTGGAGFHEYEGAQASKLIADGEVLVLDVRTPKEYYAGRIKGAKLIPVTELQGRLSELDGYHDKAILVYCRSGNRSTVAGQILNRNGFKNVHHLSGGIRAWIKEGLPVEKSD